MSTLTLINHQTLEFPSVEHALTEPNGLLAIGGDLSAARLMAAYRQGIFPWFSEGEPIMWWSPDPRAVIFCDDIHVSRSLQKTLRQGIYQITMNQAFAAVIRACAEPRHNDPGTWITPDMQAAYIKLHELGHAQSVEVWHEGQLVGGVYGVVSGRVFFGESMFHRQRDTSKLALVFIAQQTLQDFKLIDCQIPSAHLQSLGAVNIPRAEFITLLNLYCAD